MLNCDCSGDEDLNIQNIDFNFLTNIDRCALHLEMAEPTQHVTSQNYFSILADSNNNWMPSIETPDLVNRWSQCSSSINNVDICQNPNHQPTTFDDCSCLDFLHGADVDYDVHRNRFDKLEINSSREFEEYPDENYCVHISIDSGDSTSLRTEKLQSNLVTNTKRENQKQIERKYRWTLNERFAELRHLLVGHTHTHKRLQKSGILSRAIEKIKYLEKENAELHRELAESYLLINSYYIGSYPNAANTIKFEKESILDVNGEDETLTLVNDDDVTTTRVYAFFVSVLLFFAIVIFRHLTFLPTSNDSFGRILRTDEQYGFSTTDNHYSSILFRLTLSNRKLTLAVVVFMAFILRITYNRRSNTIIADNNEPDQFQFEIIHDG
ncbi:hypothetical protein GJ496_005437 [Pomphorhynchus laevis]|nr:hypothetical protein GJ496_005437 [Pomphorhynchus laevis]